MRWLSTALAATTIFAATEAQATVIVTIEEVGSDVVATGNGALDTKDLGLAGEGIVDGGQLNAGQSYVALGDGFVDLYSVSFTGPANFGPGGFQITDPGSGDPFGFLASGDLLAVPVGYISGAAISGSAIFGNATFASLGLVEGTYTYSFGSGVDADSFVLQIGPAAPAPEPASIALFGLGVAGLGLARRKARTG